MSSQRPPRRILYIESAPQAGGSSVSLFELARRIDRRAFQPLVLLCTSNPYRRRFEQAGVRVLSTAGYCSVRSPVYAPAVARARARWAGKVRSNGLTRALWQAGGLAVRTISQTWPLARRVARIIRQEKIALVHLNDAPELHKAGIIAARLAGVPCICHVRSMPPLDALDRLLARCVTHFIFISKAVESDQRRRGLGRRPGSVLYNALDLAPYASLDRQAARRTYALAADDLVVGMMGRIEPWKGQRDVLAAMSVLKPRVPRLRCLVAGTPELDGQWYMDELIAQAGALGLDDVVRFIGYEPDVPRFMAALDVLCHASTQPEPFGRVLIEGMAASLPVVATNAGGVPEIVVAGETGVLVPPSDPASLAAALSTLLINRDQAAALGRCGQTRAAALFNIGRHVAAVEEIYDRLLPV